MRLQNFLFAMLVTILVLGMLSSIAIQLEKNYGLTEEQIYQNASGAKDVVKDLDVFDQYSQLTANASTAAPGMSDSNLGEGMSVVSGIQAAFKFVNLLVTGPKLIINTFGNFFEIDDKFLFTFIIWISVTIAFIIIGSVFFQKV